ncbi:MAG: 2-amino-4-hydroxy-6-hydroxymethyldihydropteridine diphosphokinase [bacterium]|nr:2-amino-4-hydroxy-6-hydroxymethyldihydropteridine diphosphokinase [bacterium]
MAETVYILLGSNSGDRERNLKNAISRLREVEGFEIVASSGIYVSEAVGMVGENPDFMNQVVMGDFQFRPNELLANLETIELKMGRSEKGENKARNIDLDILLFGDEVIESENLSIPHRELLNRAFAMVPLLQITPDIVHPVTKKPVSEFLNEKEAGKVLLFKDHVARNI